MGSYLNYNINFDIKNMDIYKLKDIIKEIGFQINEDYREMYYKYEAYSFNSYIIRISMTTKVDYIVIERKLWESSTATYVLYNDPNIEGAYNFLLKEFKHILRKKKLNILL